MRVAVFIKDELPIGRYVSFVFSANTKCWKAPTLMSRIRLHTTLSISIQVRYFTVLSTKFHQKKKYLRIFEKLIQWFRGESKGSYGIDTWSCLFGCKEYVSYLPNLWGKYT